MARRRGTDEAVCCSVPFRTEFGRERAWGLSRFTTITQLEREGAYSRAEDCITFAASIQPIRGLVWGHPLQARRSTTTTTAAAAAVPAVAPAVNNTVVPPPPLTV